MLILCRVSGTGGELFWNGLSCLRLYPCTCIKQWELGQTEQHVDILIQVFLLFSSSPFSPFFSKEHQTQFLHTLCKTTSHSLSLDCDMVWPNPTICVWPRDDTHQIQMTSHMTPCSWVKAVSKEVTAVCVCVCVCACGWAYREVSASTWLLQASSPSSQLSALLPLSSAQLTGALHWSRKSPLWKSNHLCYAVYTHTHTQQTGTVIQIYFIDVIATCSSNFFKMIVL